MIEREPLVCYLFDAETMVVTMDYNWVDYPGWSDALWGSFGWGVEGWY